VYVGADPVTVQIPVVSETSDTTRPWIDGALVDGAEPIDVPTLCVPGLFKVIT
jgi:hypothetical protein